MNAAVGNARSAVAEMGRVVHALILRETRTRFGKQRLGYLWAVVEPIIFVTILVILFSYRGRNTIPGVSLAQFFVCGIVPFLMFRHLMGRINKAVESNMQLLVYPQVQIFDLVLARFLLEAATSFTIFVLMLWGIHILEIDTVNIQSPLGVLAGFAAMAFFGLGMGLVFGSLTPLFPSIDPLSHAFLGRPLFFLSGVFFTAEMVPDAVRPYLLLNPLFHAEELIRSSAFQAYSTTHVDVEYMLTWLILLLFLGLLLQRALRKYIIGR